MDPELLCAAMAVLLLLLFFYFTHIFQATQEELDRIWETELLVESLTCLLHLFLCCSGFCTEVHQA